MRFPTVASIVLAASCRIASGFSLRFPTFRGNSSPTFVKNPEGDVYNAYDGLRTPERVAPKVMIISMFDPESDVWYENMSQTEFGDILALNITTPGLSPLYPFVHCTADAGICQITVGEAEINTAASIMALALSPKFDLTETYFMVAGIAGISPKVGTQGSVAFSKYAVQVALQYEFDAREIPDSFSTGYFSYGSKGPDEYPSIMYGTEVFEVNENLRDKAIEFASHAALVDTESHREYGRRYLDLGDAFNAAADPPSVIKADSATSDVYFSGHLLSETFEKVTHLWTNGSGVYGVSAQEENATLGVLLRMAIDGIVDFGRIIIMRTGSNFDRPPPGTSVYEHLVVLDQAGLGVATKNIFIAGIEVIRGIVKDWDCTFKQGVPAENYMGDIFGSLGGYPDFGLGSLTDGHGVKSTGEREAMAKKRVEMRLTSRGTGGK